MVLLRTQSLQYNARGRARSGVRHIVKLSAFALLDRRLRSCSGITQSRRRCRPGGLNHSASPLHAEPSYPDRGIIHQGVVYAPSGDGKIPYRRPRRRRRRCCHACQAGRRQNAVVTGRRCLTAKRRRSSTIRLTGRFVWCGSGRAGRRERRAIHQSYRRRPSHGAISAVEER